MSRNSKSLHHIIALGLVSMLAGMILGPLRHCFLPAQPYAHR